MKSDLLFIHPLARIFIFLVIIIGAFLSSSLLLLVLGYIILLTLLFFSKQLKFHLKIILISGTPLLLLLLLVYIFILGSQFDSIIDGAIRALSLFTRVILLTALFQFTLSLRSTELMDLLRYSKLNNFIRLIILESYSSIQDLTIKADQIITARLSRGYLTKRTIINQMKQFPYILRPLFSGLIESSFEKSINWKQLQVLTRFEKWSKSDSLIYKYPILRSILIAFIALLWFFVLIISKIYD